MGCVCNTKKPTVTAQSTHQSSIKKSFKKNKFIMGNNIERVCDHPTPINHYNNNNRKYFNNISYKTTCIIFNFLNFKELKEIGKCNSFFKRISANPNILKKFFKKNPKFTLLCCTNQSGNKNTSTTLEKDKEENIEESKGHNNTLKTGDYGMGVIVVISLISLCIVVRSRRKLKA